VLDPVVKKIVGYPVLFRHLGLRHLYLGIPWVNHLSFPARTALLQPPKLAGVSLLNSGSHRIDEWYVFYVLINDFSLALPDYKM